MIHYLSYYRSDKNLGKAMNEAIDSLCVPDDDWIVLRDMDMCFLTPDAGKQIEHVANTTDYGLLGCMTNRVRGQHQLVGEFSEHLDGEKEYKKALVEQNYHYGEIEMTDKSIGGFFMLFQRKTWFDVGGFEENNLKADWQFTNQVRNSGKKIGLIKGLYVFHLYRPWHLSYLKSKKYTNHLK